MYSEDNDTYNKAFYDKLTRICLDAKQRMQKEQLWISICGSPGSGKSTLAANLARSLNNSSNECNDSDNSTTVNCTVLPADGYHYYKHELGQMKDPDTAFARRGIYPV